MKQIAGEFYRAHLSIPLRYFIVTAICVGVMFFTGTYSNAKLRVPAIVVTAFTGAVALWALLDVLSAPKRFKSALARLPEQECEALLNGFGNARRLGKRWFSEEHVVYFANRRILFFRFDELRCADLNRNKLTVTLSDGVKMPFPFEADENPAVLVAILRSRNGELAATVDGNRVDFNKKGKGKEDVK